MFDTPGTDWAGFSNFLFFPLVVTISSKVVFYFLHSEPKIVWNGLDWNGRENAVCILA